MTKFSTGKSGKIIDLRNKKPSAYRAASVSARPANTRSASQIQPRRTSPLRVQRRKARSIIAVVLIVLLGAVAYGIHYASYMPRLTVSAIEVRGAAQVAPTAVQAVAAQELESESFRYIAKDNIFFLPRATIEQNIVAAFPYIKSAQVSRESILATTAIITVEERQPFARWCSESMIDPLDPEGAPEKCYLMDETGFVFADATASSPRPKHAYIFRGALTGEPIGKTYKPGNLPGLLGFLRLLENGGYLPLGVLILDERDFQVPLSAGYYIKGSFGGHPDVMVKNLQLILLADALHGKEAELEYVDLRFGNRVYYKLKGETEVDPAGVAE